MNKCNIVVIECTYLIKFRPKQNYNINFKNVPLKERTLQREPRGKTTSSNTKLKSINVQ